MGFKEWYQNKHGNFPGNPLQPIDQVFEQLADALAEYVDEQLARTPHKEEHEG